MASVICAMMEFDISLVYEPLEFRLLSQWGVFDGHWLCLKGQTGLDGQGSVFILTYQMTAKVKLFLINSGLALTIDFAIWAGSRRRIVYTKEEYAFDLGDTMRRYRYLNLGKPAIWIKGNHAAVLVPMSVDGRNTRNTFHMVRKGDTWLFLDSEF